MSRDRVVVRPYGHGVYGIEVDGNRVGLLDHYAGTWSAILVPASRVTRHSSRGAAVGWLVKAYDQARARGVSTTDIPCAEGVSS